MLSPAHYTISKSKKKKSEKNQETEDERCPLCFHLRLLQWFS
jgi:hypothetical protein